MAARPADAPVDGVSPLADPATRLLARLIDLTIPFVPALVLTPAGAFTNSSDLVLAGLIGIFAVALALFPLNLFWLHRYGQSVGKRLVGIRIVCTEGERAPLGRVFWRRMMLPTFIEAIPLLGALFTLVDALLIFTPSRQTLHDRFAGTIVIDLRRDEPLDLEAVRNAFR